MYLAESDNKVNWACKMIRERYNNIERQNLFSGELKEFLILLQKESVLCKNHGVTWTRIHVKTEPLLSRYIHVSQT
jgi:hypothetical protein